MRFRIEMNRVLPVHCSVCPSLSYFPVPSPIPSTGRSPLWRATFNNHMDMVKLLLLHGGDPDARDTVSMETAFDVTSSSDIRDLLVSLEPFTETGTGTV